MRIQIQPKKEKHSQFMNIQGFNNIPWKEYSISKETEYAQKITTFRLVPVCWQMPLFSIHGRT